MTRLERRAFTALLEWSVAPAAPLPTIAETDASESFARYLADSPALNRTGIRAVLAFLELAPIVLGPGRQGLSALDAGARDRFLDRRLEGRLGPVLTALRGLTQVSYYGDRDVMRLLGYDAAAVVDRGRVQREAEHRW